MLIRSIYADFYLGALATNIFCANTSRLEAWYLAELKFRYQRTTGIEILSNE